LKAARDALIEKVSFNIVDDIVNETVEEEALKTASLTYG